MAAPKPSEPTLTLTGARESGEGVGGEDGEGDEPASPVEGSAGLGEVGEGGEDREGGQAPCPDDPPERRERVSRQALGQGARDREPDLAGRMAVIHWLTTGTWAPPPGFTFALGPDPEGAVPLRGDGFILTDGQLARLIRDIADPVIIGRRIIGGLRGDIVALVAKLGVAALSPDREAEVRMRLVVLEGLAKAMRRVRMERMAEEDAA